MAICPECFEDKHWLARRCNHCNQYIGFIRQTFAMLIYFLGVVFGIWAIWKIFVWIFG